MVDLINWCNTNQGFLALLLACITSIISVIAITVSIQTARLPYKKKIKINTYYKYDFDNKFRETINGGYACSIEIINIGNRDICSKYVGIGYYNNKQLKQIYSNKMGYNSKVISPTNMMETDIFAIELLDVSQKIDPKTKIYAIFIDTEDKITKKYLGRLNQIVKDLIL